MSSAEQTGVSSDTPTSQVDETSAKANRSGDPSDLSDTRRKLDSVTDTAAHDEGVLVRMAPKKRTWAEWFDAVDGIALMASIVVAMAITLRSDLVEDVREEVHATRAVANEAFQTFNDLKARGDDGLLDTETVSTRMRNLRYLHYTTDRQIPAGRQCLDLLIRQIDSYATLRVKEPQGVAMVDTERDGPRRFDETIEANMNNLKARISRWEEVNSHLFWPILAWIPLGESVDFFDLDSSLEGKCLSAL
jgi:hypothetical protein